MDKPLTDDLLIAYADGQLDPDTQQQVAQQLRDNPQAQATVQRLQEADTLLSDTLGPCEDEPVPEWLSQAVAAIQPSAQPQPEPAPTIKTIPGQAASNTPWFQAVAAVLLLSVGLGGGWLSHDLMQGSEVATVQPESLRHQALETLASGQSLDTTVAGIQHQVLPLLSFHDPQGRICREFEHRRQGDQGFSEHLGVACRDGAGSWHTEVLVARDLAAPTTADDGGFYAPVSGDSEPDAFQQFIEPLQASAPLTPAEEAALMAQGWKP